MDTVYKTDVLPVIRELVRAFQAFEQYSARHVRELGLTPPQFDVIATLGNTPGMSCKELSEKTLITKGTLTGVIDRLAEKGVVTRQERPEDRRSVFLSLTSAGEELFRQVFPAHCDYMHQAFSHCSRDQLQLWSNQLAGLKAVLNQALEKQENEST
ncbi:MarR family winged helix-turn-helix transcriptional regulator [Pseudogulbenkiania subflava]|uniref:DNA-binding transcriptional regulator, MarR family n=1 Tax=Pseudogulbenkiania subflava DSM 22618 TaxID=1123014 RepID=A0A1Y6C8S4_9NEIS|nr:MarR family transcriptional regulator [Pseudogulbenkiania subflava]SMF40310.1 DNA-binding transcriptional regulator, MarR family [Pseudogulbenkiania subflava DSM 22618]